MDKHQCIIIEMQNVAFLSYLRLCESLKEAPRAEIYNQIKDCNDSKKLYQITTFIENERESFDNRTPPKHENFFTKLFKF